ncbi:hypothetical protein ACOSQ3_027419 [Xanthoceras sorbifolium]
MHEASLPKVVSWSSSYLHDYRLVIIQTQAFSKLIKLPVKWQPPGEGLVKINTDVALDVVNQLVGFGEMIRNHLGQVLGSYW